MSENLEMPESGSIGFRAPHSKLLASDRASKILGHKFEENLLKQAIGQCILSCRDVMPSTVAVFATGAEMDAILRSGICGTLASAFRGSLELRELTQPSLRDFLLARRDSAAVDPAMVVLLGSEKRPAAWPLPDFAKMLPGESHQGNAAGMRHFNPVWGYAGDWLRLDRKGNVSAIGSKTIEGCWSAREAAPAIARPFEYSWGVWAAVVPPAAAPARKLRLETVKLASHSAGQLVLSSAARTKIAHFINNTGTETGAGIFGSFPTPEAGRWLLQNAGIELDLAHRIHFVEAVHGWGPAFSLLQFYSDFPAGSRMVMMRDLASADLMVIE